MMCSHCQVELLSEFDVSDVMGVVVGLTRDESLVETRVEYSKYYSTSNIDSISCIS